MQVVRFWKGKTEEALVEVEKLKRRVEILERDIIKEKKYLEDLIAADSLRRDSPKVC